MSLPEETYKEGWPEFLTDNQGKKYVRLRDGKQTSKFAGEACLYGLLDEDDCIDEDRQWTPVYGATEDDMVLSGGSWMDPAEFVRYGQTPIVIPDEPCTPPSPPSRSHPNQ